MTSQRQFPLLEKFDLFKDSNTEAPTAAPTVSDVPTMALTINGTDVNGTDPCPGGEVC